MKPSLITVALAASVLLFAANPSFATEKEHGASDEAATTSKASKSTTVSKKKIAERRKANAKIKPVDINSASKEELKKLPGVGDAEADQIIAGRPYGSKSWLATNKVISEGLFNSISLLIIAKQPKDDAKNAALHPQKK